MRPWLLLLLAALAACTPPAPPQPSPPPEPPLAVVQIGCPLPASGKCQVEYAPDGRSRQIACQCGSFYEYWSEPAERHTRVLFYQEWSDTRPAATATAIAR